MPRIRTFSRRRAYRDLAAEIRGCMARRELIQADLAAAVGVARQTISKRLRKPEDLTVAELRTLVCVLRLDMVPVLRALGYPGKELQQMPDGGETLTYRAAGDEGRYRKPEAGKRSGRRGDDRKVCGKRLRIGAEIGIPGFVKAQVEWEKSTAAGAAKREKKAPALQ